jgi:hypothetical protein
MGGGGSPEFPFVGWGGQETREEENQERGGWSQPAGRPAIGLAPQPGPEEGAACPSPFPPLPPRAPWLPSLPAGSLPSQTAARRGRSISEQRGPCGLRLKSRIPLSHRQVKRESAHAHKHTRKALWREPAPAGQADGWKGWDAAGVGWEPGATGMGVMAVPGVGD